jgi:hypothetical protein
MKLGSDAVADDRRERRPGLALLAYSLVFRHVQ